MGIRKTARAAALRAMGAVAVAGVGITLAGSGASAAPIVDVSAVVAADGNTGGNTTWSGPSFPSREDRAAIRQLRHRQEDAWARGDGKAYASIYEKDADLINFFGEHLHGRETIAATMQGYFDSVLSGTRLLQLDEKLRFVSPDLAVVLRTSCVLPADERTCPDDSIFVNSNIAVRHDGEWLITSFQNTLIQSMPEGGPDDGDESADEHSEEDSEAYTES
jgi:uncharacterized protein (TIGR02246 family)